LTRAVLAWGPAVLWAAVLFFLSAQPDPPGAHLFDWIPAGDKLGHFLLYGVLGMLLAHGREGEARPNGGRLPHAASIAGGSLYGASDEWHQSFVPGREVSALDWAADVGGVSAGYWFGLTVLRRRASRRAAGAH
jgi:VanZ family protein